VAERAAAALPTGKVASVRPVSQDVVAADIVSKLDPLKAKKYTDDMRDAGGIVPGVETWLTGGPAIQSDGEPVSNRDLKVGELYIAIPAALLVLAFVFGTLALLIPFIVTLCAIPATLAVVWIAAHYVDMAEAVRNLVFLIGLGIAIDYSLIIVYRYREELRKGIPKEEAVVKTMKTAGHAVVFSGTAVVIGLALLMFIPVPMLRGFGLAGLVIPLVSIVCALTLVPVVLYSLEGKLDRVRLVPKRILERRASAGESNFWVRLAHTIMRRPVVFLVTSLAILLVATAPALSLDLGPGTNEQLPAGLESTRGLRILQSATGGGAIAPAEIIIDTGRPGGFDDPEAQIAEGNLFLAVAKDSEVGSVEEFGQGRQFLDPTRRYVHEQATLKDDAGLPESDAFVHRFRDQLVPAAGFPAGTRVYLGGSPAGGVDFLDRTYAAFPWLVLAVLVLTYFLLLRAFRSLLLPLKAIVLNLLSIGAAFGASRNKRARRAPTEDHRERHAGIVTAPAPGRRLIRGWRNDVRLRVPRTRSWQLPQVLRRSTARAYSAPCKVPAPIIKGVAYHAECVLRACAPAPARPSVACPSQLGAGLAVDGWRRSPNGFSAPVRSGRARPRRVSQASQARLRRRPSPRRRPRSPSRP